MNAGSYVYRGLKTNKRRYGLGAASIVISTTIMIMIGAVFTGSQNEIRGFFERAYAYDFEVSAATTDVNSTYFEAAPVVHNITRESGVTGAYPVLSTVLFAYSNQTQNNRPLLSYGVGQDYTAGHQNSLQGKYDLSPGHVVMTVAAAKKFSFKVGDTVRLNDPFSNYPVDFNVTVSGIVDLEGRFPPTVNEYAILGFDFLGGELNLTGNASSVLVLVEPSLYDFNNPADPVGHVLDVGRNIAVSLGPGYTVNSIKDYLIETGIQGTSFFGIMIYIFSIFFPAISGIMVASILNLSVEDKAHDLGVLRLLGARRTTVGKILLYELALIIVLGLPLGVVLGIALPLTYLSQYMTGATPMAIAGTIAVQLAISLLVLLAFAVKPLQRAFRSSPVDAVRRTRALGTLRFQQDGGIDRRIPFAGLVIFIAVAYSTLVIPYILIFSSGMEIIFYLLVSVMVMLVCLSVGMLMFASRLETTMVAVARPVTEKVNKLAQRSITRYARRNLSTNMIFGVVVAILIFFTSLISSVRGSVDDAARYQSGADIRVTSIFEMSQLEFDQMVAIAGVEAGAGVGPALQVTVSGLVGPSGETVRIQGADSKFPSVTYISQSDFYQGRPSDFDLHNGSIILSRAVATALDVNRGDKVRIDKEDRRSFLTVTAVLNSLPGFPLQVSQTSRNAITDYQAAFVSFSQYNYIANKTFGGDTYTSIFLKLRPGVNASKVGDDVRSRFADVEGFVVSVTAENIQAVRFYTGYLDVIFSAVLLGMMMVAVFSLMSNLYASIKEREFEIGVLRAVGYRRSQILSSLMTEGLAVALGSVLLGMLVGLVVGYIMVWFIGLLAELGFRFVFPWSIIALVLAVTLVASALGVALTSRVVMRRQLIDLIKRAE